MIWDGITGGQKTRLLVVNGTLNAQKYINQVLVPEGVPFMQRNAQIVTLQQDNARPHTARLTQHFLQQNNIIVLPWPANSPDLNPIEHIWDKLGKDIWNQQISNIRDLETALQGAWASLTPNVIQRYVNSMRRRLLAVLASRGGHKRY